MSDERTLGGYLDAVASSAPAPGGGSVVGIVGALSAALGQMVLNFTDAPDDEAAARRDDLLSSLKNCREHLMQAAEEDEAAYQGYLHASSLPRKTPVEKLERRNAMQSALIVATDVPLAMAEQAARLTALLVEIAQIGNRRLATDAALSALLAEAALRGALLNVRGNAALLKDDEKTEHYREAADRLEAEGRRAVAMALETASMT